MEFRVGSMMGFRPGAVKRRFAGAGGGARFLVHSAAMKRLLPIAACAALLGGCEIPPYQVPVASDSAAGIAYWRCDQMAIALIGDENDLFRQVFEREQLRRRCLSGENIAVQEEPPAPAAPAAPESSPRPAGAIPPPPVVQRR